MDEQEIRRAVAVAIDNSDETAAERLLSQHPEILKVRSGRGTWLHRAAYVGALPIVQLLVRLGLNPNEPLVPGNAPEGALREAVQKNHIEIVRWLLDHGANSNCVQEGVVRNFALCDAAERGNMEIVRLLVEHGADVNATWMQRNPLWFAIACDHKDVILYLRSKGAKENWHLTGKGPENPLRDIIPHVTKHLGRPLETSLQESEPRDPPILIHFVPVKGKQKRLILVTTGMSNKPMTVPPAELEFQFAELCMHLPADWPTDFKKLIDPKYRWPIDWLRAIAHQPHDAKDWLGGRFAVIANGDPPQPIAAKVPFTAFLLATSDSEFERFILDDYRILHFYLVTPIYTEEYDLARKKGPEALIKLFEEHKISQTYDLNRPNVAKKGKK